MEHVLNKHNSNEAKSVPIEITLVNLM